MMATSLLWLASVLVAVSTIGRCSGETLSAQNQNRQLDSRKVVEILELLSRGFNSSDAKIGFGIQKVPQEGDPNYEILITPNKDLQELKGSQKIKIFVEAANYSPEKSQSQESVKREKHNTYDVVPLSIETVGLNIQQNQQTGLAGIKVSHREVGEESLQRDSESNPSKRQTTWGSNNKGRSVGKSEGIIRQPEIKEVVIQREPSYVDQNNPYQPVSSPKKEERPIYDGDYSSSSQNGKRIVQQTYRDDYEEPVRSQNRPKEPKRTYEPVYPVREETPVYEVRPTNERRPIVRDPEDPPSQRRPTYNREEESFSPSESRNPSYNEERRPNYGIEEVRPTNERRPVYSREPEKARPSNERYPDYEEVRPSANRPVYVSEPEDPEPPVRRPTGSSIAGGYEDPSEDINRPVRDNSGYSGFPESHPIDSGSHYSTPLQYENRVFPASPCLNVFKYEGREPEVDRWYGDIYVSTDEVLTGMRLDVRLDRPAEILSNWMSEVTTKDSTHFTILSLTHRLVPGTTETVKIMVKFNRKKAVPYLKSISLNGRQICPTHTSKTTTKRPVVYENPADIPLNSRRTTPTYQEGPKRPVNSGDYGTPTKRTTPYPERRPTTPSPRPQPEYNVRPNPNGYEDTDQNSFNAPTKKPPGRPAHSNGKPPPHAAKPAQGSKPGNGNGHGNGHGQSHGQTSNKNPSSSGNKPSPVPTNNNQGSQGQTQGLCGTPSIQPRPLITHGQLTSRGQWPWHVALYKNVGTDLTFFCSGSLINSNYVLTAAHCVTKTYTTKPLDENTLVVYLGKYHLNLWSEGGVQNRQVNKIYVHPKYNSTDFRNDIAVLALSRPVEYSEFVRPICLWDRTYTSLQDVVGKLGTVVGWGFDETKKLSEELRQAKMPVVAQEDCLRSYPEFYPQFTSTMTFCAGFKNGTSVCNGDSGGGMVFPYKDNSGVERWRLRGMVSISPAKNDSRVCDTNHYVVFTDVAKYFSWLDNFV